MNISLGSSATAVSNMLDHRVDITTPQVSIVHVDEFSLGPLKPAIGVEIKYVSGLEGSNIMLLKMSDIKIIVDILMGMETPEEEFELNELTLSAVCEVMNQMMGAASTALSDFLGRMVNISTPQTFDLNDLEAFKRERLPVSSGSVVVVRFALKIEGAMQSEFMNVMSVELARELVSGFGLGDYVEPAPQAASSDGGTMSQEEIERLMSAMAAPAPTPAPEPESKSGGTMSQEEIERLMANMSADQPAPPAAAPQTPQTAPQMPQAAPPQWPQDPNMPASGAVPPGYPPMPYGHYPYPVPEGYAGQPPYPMMGYYMPPGWPYPPEMQHKEQTPPEPKVIHTQAAAMPRLESGEELGEEQAQNLDLIMAVPLEVTVEIGRTRKRVQDILSFSKGSLVVLDKLAGDQVDLFVNGKCIARGDVVVIEDNFGIRISEILRRPEIGDISFP